MARERVQAGPADVITGHTKTQFLDVLCIHKQEVG